MKVSEETYLTSKKRYLRVALFFCSLHRHVKEMQ